MCNLYKLQSTASEVAALFGGGEGAASNAREEVYPGYPGLVVAAGAVRSMVWGFPLVLKGKSGQPLKPKPVNNARTDKLDGFMWRYSFAERRCLIPVSAFAEAEGEKGAMTRTWFSLPDQAVFAVAGIWRDTDEWGPAYAMVMTEACVHVAGVHERMPVILRSDQWGAWCGGAADEARAMCVPYAGEMAVQRTGEPWFRKRGT